MSDTVRLHMSKRILVVEDDPPIREVVKRILSREGYIIDEAGDGEEHYPDWHARAGQ